MTARLKALRWVAATLSILGLISVAPASALAQSTPAPGAATISSSHVCMRPTAPGQVRCHALIRTDALARSERPGHGHGATASLMPNVLGSGGAYSPAYLQSAYQTPSASGGSGQTVAIVDAYDNPNAELDLAAYRSFFGLPACGSSSGCFRKVNQNGQSGPLPNADGSWSQEISLDLDMVSALCPNCHILLVEANNNSTSNLATAVNTAASMGANAISNSYGSSEFSSETSLDASFNHPGVAITASTGDSGYGVEWPAASPYVTAVGGTTLNQLTSSGSRDATETVWNGTGSGCSVYEPKPSWQKDTGCLRRTVGDVAAEADPSTGVWVYDSFVSGGQSGWLIFGGTSAASPIVASVYALAGNGSSASTLASYPYATPSALNDVTAGSNGACGNYLCNAQPGYDAPTGLGTPNGTTAFRPGATSGSACYTSVAATQVGPNLTISIPSAGQVALNWTRLGSETGYCIVRWTPAKTDVLTGPSASQSLTWTDSAPPSTACYMVLSVTSGTVVATSDLLCALPTTHAGTAPPRNVTLSLAKSTTASLTWTPPTGATAQSLYIDPLNGATPQTQALSGASAGATIATGGTSGCYVVSALESGVTLGNADALCAVPGQASGGLPAASPANPSQLSIPAQLSRSSSIVRTIPPATRRGARGHKA